MLVLMDSHYWTRLWCVFEFAAFVKRAGPGRVDIIPLHIPLLISIWALGFSLFELCLCFVILLLPQETQSWVFESNMHNALYCSIFLAPAGFVALLAQLQSIEAQAAIKELESFTLREAGCYKDIDRDAIMDLISD